MQVSARYLSDSKHDPIREILGYDSVQHYLEDQGFIPDYFSDIAEYEEYKEIFNGNWSSVDELNTSVSVVEFSIAYDMGMYEIFHSENSFTHICTPAFELYYKHEFLHPEIANGKKTEENFEDFTEYSSRYNSSAVVKRQNRRISTQNHKAKQVLLSTSGAVGHKVSKAKKQLDKWNEFQENATLCAEIGAIPPFDKTEYKAHIKTLQRFKYYIKLATRYKDNTLIHCKIGLVLKKCPVQYEPVISETNSFSEKPVVKHHMKKDRSYPRNTMSHSIGFNRLHHNGHYSTPTHDYALDRHVMPIEDFTLFRFPCYGTCHF